LGSSCNLSGEPRGTIEVATFKHKEIYMQKKIIALAVAGLMSGAAFAQSNVTVYGVLDATWENAKASGATVVNSDILSRARMSSNSSLIGFKGAEDLGNGMKAVFQYESAITSDTAGAMAGGRDTYVGLAGGFGTFVMGTLTHPIRTMGAKVDFNPGASSAGFTGSMYGEFAGVKTGTDDRATNALAYVSPNFSGFTVTGAWVNGETRNVDGAAVNFKGYQYQLAGQYENGPLYVGLGYHMAHDPQVDAAVRTAVGLAGLGAGTYNDKLKDIRLAAVYKLPTDTSISFLWDNQKYSQGSNAGASEAKRNAYMFGVKQSFGMTDVWAQYAAAKDVSGAICGAITCGNTGAKQYTLGASYNMSKRTAVHGFYTKLSNDSGVAYDNYVNGLGLAFATRGADTTVWGAGLRHSF